MFNKVNKSAEKESKEQTVGVTISGQTNKIYHLVLKFLNTNENNYFLIFF